MPQCLLYNLSLRNASGDSTGTHSSRQNETHKSFSNTRVSPAPNIMYRQETVTFAEVVRALLSPADIESSADVVHRIRLTLKKRSRQMQMPSRCTVGRRLVRLGDKSTTVQAETYAPHRLTARHRHSFSSSCRVHTRYIDSATALTMLYHFSVIGGKGNISKSRSMYSRGEEVQRRYLKTLSVTCFWYASTVHCDLSLCQSNFPTGR